MSRLTARVVVTAMVTLVSTAALAQIISVPRSGDNQRSVVTQYIGPVSITIDYHSPNVHASNGDDRRGKIWGQLVPYGLHDPNFGSCKQCPWRAGANENTTFETSHDVLIEGQRLAAGKYGLHMIADPEEWTLIFSRNSTSWGSFFYDPAEDVLRVRVKPQKSPYREWLTYDFKEKEKDRATVAMEWEDLQVPWTVTVPDIAAVHIAAIRNDLRGFAALQWQNWNSAARYALGAKRLDDALEFARVAAAITLPGQLGQENFTTLMTLADVQEAKSMTAEASATREKALNTNFATPQQLDGYAMAQLRKGNKVEAARVWRLSARRFPNQWPVNAGLMRALSAEGKYREALKYGRLALTEAPNEAAKKSVEAAIQKLQEGKDANS